MDASNDLTFKYDLSSFDKDDDCPMCGYPLIESKSGGIYCEVCGCGKETVLCLDKVI